MYVFSGRIPGRGDNGEGLIFAHPASLVNYIRGTVSVKMSGAQVFILFTDLSKQISWIFDVWKQVECRESKKQSCK